MLLQENLESFFLVCDMVLEGLAEDQNIIKEDNDEVTEIWPENGIHHCLKRGGGVV